MVNLIFQTFLGSNATPNCCLQSPTVCLIKSHFKELWSCEKEPHMKSSSVNPYVPICIDCPQILQLLKSEKLPGKWVLLPYMNGGFFVGQGVFCLDVKFFTPRIFFRSRIRNFTSRIFFFLDLAFGHVKDFPSIFFLTPRNPKDFVSK